MRVLLCIQLFVNMAVFYVFGLVLVIASVSAVPTPDPVIFKLNDGLRFQYRGDGEGNAYLVDQWFKVSDAKQAARYDPDLQNVYHLFTRRNPSISQPMHFGSSALLANSNYSPLRRTIFIVHGWGQSASSNIIALLVPAFLQMEDVNVFAVDWSAGAGISAGTNAFQNTVTSGLSVARTIDWIIFETGANIGGVHLVGFSLGAHQVGVAGRNVRSGRIPYITALDPGANMEESGHVFGPDAAIYTEAIHTNSVLGHGGVVAHSDFFPNGGDSQPGCGIVNIFCSHDRSFFFFAETLTTTTGFDATRCQSVEQAKLGLCDSVFSVRMGGLMPKIGTSGIFYLRTNAQSPFSTT